MKCFITGASSGLGLRLTVDLLKNMQAVIGTYYSNPQPLLYLQKKFTKLHPQYLYLKESEKLEVEDTSLDALIFYAGAISSKLLLKETTANFVEQIETNLSSSYKLCQKLIPKLKSSGNAHIIFISSFSALHGNVGQTSYSTAKSALSGMAQGLARELAPDNIKVNVVLPGFMKSKQTLALPVAVKNSYREANLLHRSNTLQEISKFILHLLSTKNISGQTFNLDSRA